MKPIGSGEMTIERKKRRVLILCLNCVRNLIYCRGTPSISQKATYQNYWQTILNNFLDITILEWCKLFADERSGKHYWKKVIVNKDDFENKLMLELGLSEIEFEQYIEQTRIYRDKFVAHLDHENEMEIPDLEIILKSTSFLYRWLYNDKDVVSYFPGIPILDDYMDDCTKMVNVIYEEKGVAKRW